MQYIINCYNISYLLTNANKNKNLFYIVLYVRMYKTFIHDFAQPLIWGL